MGLGMRLWFGAGDVAGNEAGGRAGPKAGDEDRDVNGAGRVLVVGLRMRLVV